MVVGAGVAGLRSALDLAETGYGVTLVDRGDHPGGLLALLDRQFPTDSCGMCRMLPMLERDSSGQYCLRRGLFHSRVALRLGTEVVSVGGEAGDFQVTLRTLSSGVDPSRCIGCGLCEEACMVETADPFNQGLTRRKAIYLPTPHMLPNSYRIDHQACIRCGDCEKVCPTGAVRLSEEERRDFRLLVVDDEQVVRDSLKEWLELDGFSVDSSASGEEALELLGRARYDLLLVDIKMPGMDGVEILRRTREGYPDIAVIMITAYATVDTAVEAMKMGAVDYLVKPFDPETLAPMVEAVYQERRAPGRETLEVGAIVLACGASWVDPSEGFEWTGYGRHPNVVTSLELERILSGCGPTAGELVRPSDQAPVRKMAWLQCVGSRDAHAGTEYCSSVCCMIAVKQAGLCREKCGPDLDTAVFFMDMRTFGRAGQRYRDSVESDGARFLRVRVHSVIADPEGDELKITYAGEDGGLHEEFFDMAVLSVGAGPAAETEGLSRIMELETDQSGFITHGALAPALSRRKGVVLSGSFPGPRDIAGSVILAGAAAAEASRVIHEAGGGLSTEEGAEARRVSRAGPGEQPRVMMALCCCGIRGNREEDWDGLARRLAADPGVVEVHLADEICTQKGWEELEESVRGIHPNRLVIGACLPCLYAGKRQELADALGLEDSCMEVVSIHAPGGGGPGQGSGLEQAVASLGVALAGIRRPRAPAREPVPVEQRALVVGAGIAGLTASLMIADHGHEVVLVEKAHQPGGNMLWLSRTLEGEDPGAHLDEVLGRVRKHPLITLLTGSEVCASSGRVGRFNTKIRDSEGGVRTVSHGVTILATGGREHRPEGYGASESDRVVTQQQLEQGLADGSIDPEALGSVVMIQCAGTRREPRNYCSRVCCPAAVKHALYLKEKNPGVEVRIFFRDLMTPGMAELYATEARRAGVTFIRYDADRGPEVEAGDGEIAVRGWEPVLGRDILVKPDLVVLAGGVEPALSGELAGLLGAETDRDGFFKEADPKWRPVDGMREGVFACGLALSPGTAGESSASAAAAAMRALRILARESITADGVTARVRHAFCSLCRLCLDACPYGARFLDEDEEEVRVDPVMCQGCGSCAAICPNSAAVLDGFDEHGMMEGIESAVWAALG